MLVDAIGMLVADSGCSRKPISDQLKEKATPDSQKSTLDKASESVTSGADKVAGSVLPQDSKSTVRRHHDN